MRSIRILAIVVLASCAGTAPSASAVITAFWQPVASGDGSVGTTYPAAAVTADEALLGMQTWDLMVTTDGNWSEAGLRATLPGGSSFYRGTNAGITYPEPVTAQRRYWTYVRVPLEHGPDDHNPTNILGGFPVGTPLSNGSANGTNTTGVLSVRWGDLVNDVPGTSVIARLTFPLGVLPDVLTADQSATFSFTAQTAPASSLGIPELPEPASGTLALLALRGAARRRTRAPR